MTSGDRGLQSGRLSRPAPGAVAQPGYDTCVAARAPRYWIPPRSPTSSCCQTFPDRLAWSHWPVSAPETESRCSVPDRWV